MPRFLRPSVLVVLALGVLEAGLYFLELPGIRDIPGWFYHPEPRGLPTTPVWVALAVAVPWVFRVAWIRLERNRAGQALALLVAASMGAQLAVSGLGGENELWERLALGHSEFYPAAAARRGKLLETMRDYDRLAVEGKVSTFGPTKPPGTYAVYALVVELAEVAFIRAAVAPLAERAARYPRIRGHAHAAALAVVLFPLLTALTCLPLWWLAVALFSSRAAAFGACLLWATAPAVLVIGYHLDGAVFPFLGTLACAAAAHGARSGRRTSSLAGGATLALGVYCSVSLLPVFPLLLAAQILILAARRDPARQTLRAIAVHHGLVLAGALGGLGLLMLFLGFDPFERLPVALAHHARWKAAVPTELWRVVAPLEWALYAGLPLVGWWLFSAAGSLVRWPVRGRRPGDVARLGLVPFLAALTAVAGTNEVARIWIFLIPFVAVVVAGSATVGRHEVPSGPRPPTLGALLVTLAFVQGALGIVLKGTQGW